MSDVAMENVGHRLAQSDLRGYDFGQRLHGLFERGVLVVAMALIEVDIVGPKALKRGVDLLMDLSARQSLVLVRHGREQLSPEDVRVARATRQMLAEELLGRAATIDVGRVDEVDSDPKGGVETAAGDERIDPDPISEPRAERDFRDLEVAASELTILNGICS